jgi:hypothetical protein
MPAKYEITLKNPTRRKVHTSLYIEAEFADIFILEQKYSKTTLLAKSVSCAVIKFVPKIAVSYNSQAFFETDLGSSTIAISGTGVEALLLVSCDLTAFGVVGQGIQEYREITLTNPTILGMPLRFKVDNPTFSFELCECFLQPGEERIIKIQFEPEVKEKLETCEISMVLLEPDAGEQNEYSFTEYTLRNEIQSLKSMQFQGTGGTMAFMANGMRINTADVSSDQPLVDLLFPKINVRSKIQKSFVLENNGDVPLSFKITDKNGNVVGNAAVVSAKGVLSCTLKAGTFNVAPRTKETVIITIEGINLGSDNLDLYVETIGLTNPIKFTVGVEAESVDAVSESLKAFIRAEDSFESLLSRDVQDEKFYATDQQLWKLVLPIVHISYKLPSQELLTIPMIMPNITRPEIGPYLVRPPALPKTLPTKAKKWYMSRTSMGLEQSRVLQF